MKKSILAILIVSSALSFTGCNSAKVKETQAELETKYEVTLSYSKDIITSAEFDALSDTKKYALLSDIKDEYKENKIKKPVSITSCGKTYTLVYEDELYTMQVDGNDIYTRNITSDNKRTPYTEEERVDFARTLVKEEIVSLYVTGDSVTGTTKDNVFTVIFDEKGYKAIYYIDNNK